MEPTPFATKPLRIPSLAAANLKKHGVSLEEVITVLADPLSMNMPDRDWEKAHSGNFDNDFICEWRFSKRGLAQRSGNPGVKNPESVRFASLIYGGLPNRRNRLPARRDLL